MLFWLALAFLAAAAVGSLVFAIMRALESWRALKQLSRTAGSALDRISVSSGEIERHLQAAAASGEQLERSLAQLSRSRARLNVLTSAYADARSALTHFYPSK